MPVIVGSAAAPATGTTLGSWVEDVRDHLEGDRPQDVNTLAADYAKGSGSLVLSQPVTNIVPGARIAIGTNTLRVLAVNGLNKTLTVLGGQFGSTDAHADQDALVRVNPRFTDHRIVRALNTHLRALSAPSVGLFQTGQVDLDFVASQETYELDETVLRVLSVRREVPGPSGTWARVRAWEYVPETSELVIREGHTGFGVRVMVALAFTAISDLTAAVASTGIPASAEDIPPLGAAINLMSGREVPRNSPLSQGDTRRAEEVPPGAVAASYRGLIALWNTRVNQEAGRLAQQWPVTTP